MEIIGCQIEYLQDSHADFFGVGLNLDGFLLRGASAQFFCNLVLEIFQEVVPVTHEFLILVKIRGIDPFAYLYLGAVGFPALVGLEEILEGAVFVITSQWK